MKSTSMSINLPVISEIMEKNCGQETFVGPSFMIAALQVSASKRSETSLPLPGLEDMPFPNL
jgi:hypothetical protein